MEILFFIFIVIPLFFFAGFFVYLILASIAIALMWPVAKVAKLFGYKLPDETITTPTT